MLYLFKFLKSYLATEEVVLTPEQQQREFLSNHKKSLLANYWERQMQEAQKEESRSWL